MGELIADPSRAARLLLTLRRQGVTDRAVLTAMERVARADFLAPDYASLGGEDVIAPIGCGQISLRPGVLGALFQAVMAGRRRLGRLLVVGAGSGYSAALAAQFSGEVIAFERFGRLASEARERLAVNGVANAQIRHGDGLGGASEIGGFDGVVLAGAVGEPPVALLRQLAPGGVIVGGMAGRLARFDAETPDGAPSGPVDAPPLVATSAKAL